MRDLNLKSMAYFEATARLGSVTKAAAELSVSASAVSQQIATLEAQIGVRLFRREKRRLILTLDGDRLFQTATQAFGALRNARNSIAHQRDLRTLVLRVSPSFGVRWLGPRIGAFAAENPDWAIRIDATPDFTAFDAEAVDLDLRYGQGGWTGLAVDPVLHDLVLPLCSPGYLRSVRGAHVQETLARARLIDSVKAHCRWDSWLADQGITLAGRAYPFQFDRSSMAIEMAKQGGGVCLENAALCRAELEAGLLVPLVPEIPVIDRPAYWLVCPPQHHNRRIVRRFSQWLRACAAEHDAEVRRLLGTLGCRFGPGPEGDTPSGPPPPPHPA